MHHLPHQCTTARLSYFQTCVLDSIVAIPLRLLQQGQHSARYERFCQNAQEAVEAIVAVNQATGLRYLYDEDHTVGTWVSPMHLQYLTGDDIDVNFHPWGRNVDYVEVRLLSPL